MGNDNDAVDHKALLKRSSELLRQADTENDPEEFHRLMGEVSALLKVSASSADHRSEMPNYSTFERRSKGNELLRWLEDKDHIEGIDALRLIVTRWRDEAD